MTTTDQMNPYQAPKADLDVVAPAVAGGSLQDALVGRYDFQIGEVMSEAWRLTKGFKASFWGAAVLIYLVALIPLMLVGALMGTVAGAGGKPNLLVQIVLNLVMATLIAPLTMGMFMMAIKRAAGMPVTFSVAFSYFKKAPVAILAGLLVTLLTYVGLALLVLPGIYLGLAYAMTMPLIADRDLPAWQAMETSRKSLTHKWFRIFGLYLLVGLLVGLSALPLGIPLIWTVPWATLVIGVLYRRIFGVAGR
ncbi:MAG TPA: hypothetical protein VHU40_05215 [Polyangia bacterium]|nr:hypothetical protein [Polyangia bacterium]